MNYLFNIRIKYTLIIKKHLNITNLHGPNGTTTINMQQLL